MLDGKHFPVRPMPLCTSSAIKTMPYCRRFGGSPGNIPSAVPQSRFAQHRLRNNRGHLIRGTPHALELCLPGDARTSSCRTDRSNRTSSDNNSRKEYDKFPGANGPKPTLYDWSCWSRGHRKQRAPVKRVLKANHAGRLVCARAIFTAFPRLRRRCYKKVFLRSSRPSAPANSAFTARAIYDSYGVTPISRCAGISPTARARPFSPARAVPDVQAADAAGKIQVAVCRQRPRSTRPSAFAVNNRSHERGPRGIAASRRATSALDFGPGISVAQLNRLIALTSLF